ncbi:UPF0538 protein C2orf76 homolog isoform X2 [Halichondria panicea]|uniref:UPF0538 protein C2orf76 homolog isoform X2 n=1 Tax=Halichondria panicea TaxID=6063 RepID=UPI00312B3946
MSSTYEPFCGDSTQELTLCIRVIRSFEYRSIKTLVLRGVPQSLLVKDLMERILGEIQQSKSLPPSFKKHQYDCLKIHSHAHGAKTNDTAINLDHDEWILSPDKTLLESDIRNETEISFFLKQDYEKYKKNPQFLW